MILRKHPLRAFGSADPPSHSTGTSERSPAVVQGLVGSIATNQQNKSNKKQAGRGEVEAVHTRKLQPWGQRREIKFKMNWETPFWKIAILCWPGFFVDSKRLPKDPDCIGKGPHNPCGARTGEAPDPCRRGKLKIYEIYAATNTGDPWNPFNDLPARISKNDAKINKHPRLQWEECL